MVFHRPEGWVEIRQRTLTRYDRIRHDLAEIERAMVQTNNSGDGGPTHRVALVIPDGQSKGKHPLTNYYTGGAGADRATKAINGWLDSARTPRLNAPQHPEVIKASGPLLKKGIALRQRVAPTGALSIWAARSLSGAPGNGERTRHVRELSERLSGVFDRLTKQGALSEDDVKTALREVRVALLEADVSLPSRAISSRRCRTRPPARR